MALLFGGVADDLTGGLELAAMLRAEGVTCEFVSDPDALADAEAAEAIVVALRTRVAPRETAMARFRETAERLRALGAPRLFFKYCATFDSTDDGNIGPCADILSASIGAERTLFAPSFPEAGRRVFQGHLFCDDQLVSESPKRHDPLTPMTDPNLVRVLQRQTQARVGLLPQQFVRGGIAPMRARIAALAEAGCRYVIADAATPGDLAALAELTVEWPLATGNSSLAAYYPALWRARGWTGPPRPPSLPPVAGAGVVLAGSCAERTLKQLEVFARERPVRLIDLERETEAEAVTNAVEWATQKLDEGPVAIATSAEPQAVTRIQHRFGQRQAARLAEDVLGRIASALRDWGVRRFLIAGGETSGAVLSHLGVRRLQVGAYRSPGVSQAVSEGEPTLAFCLKSGKLGPEDMFMPMLDSLARGES